MNKKNNLALLTFFVVGFFSLFTINILAQNKISPKTDTTTKPCSGEKFVMPTSIALGNEIFSDYLKVATLTNDKRGEVFRKFSNEQKAKFIKVNLALQLIKRPDMTNDQKEFVLDAISKVSADFYDKSDPEKINRSEQSGSEIENRALGLFTNNDLGDFIEPLMTNKNEEVALLQKYEDLLKNGMRVRKKLVKEMPVNDRVNIWKTQLVYHLITANLSQPQREFILEFMTTLSPATIVRPVNETKEESAKALEILDKKIQSVFSRTEEFAIFETLGIQKIVTDPIETNIIIDSPWKFCDCRWYCGVSESCGGGCNVQVQECGPTGSWYCSGKCAGPNQ